MGLKLRGRVVSGSLHARAPGNRFNARRNFPDFEIFVDLPSEINDGESVIVVELMRFKSDEERRFPGPLPGIGIWKSSGGKFGALVLFLNRLELAGVFRVGMFCTLMLSKLSPGFGTVEVL